MTLKLKPEIKELWCNALDSKEYPQAKGGLRSDTGFCCLGVLGDLAVKAGLAEWEGQLLRSNGTLQGAYFPNALLSWACSKMPKNTSLDDNTTFSIPKGSWPATTFSLPPAANRNLAELNDQGMTFPEIAKIIREHF